MPNPNPVLKNHPCAKTSPSASSNPSTARPASGLPGETPPSPPSCNTFSSACPAFPPHAPSTPTAAKPRPRPRPRPNRNPTRCPHRNPPHRHPTHQNPLYRQSRDRKMENRLTAPLPKRSPPSGLLHDAPHDHTYRGFPRLRLENPIPKPAVPDLRPAQPVRHVRRSTLVQCVRHAPGLICRTSGRSVPYPPPSHPLPLEKPLL